MFFNSLNIRKKWINSIAASTFSVYLIHENCHVNTLLYDYVREFSNGMNIVTLICILLVVALAVFVACIIIDSVRIVLFTTIKKVF